MRLGCVIEYLLANIDEGEHEFRRLTFHGVYNTFLNLKEFKCDHLVLVDILHGLEVLNLIFKFQIIADHFVKFFAGERLVHGKNLAEQVCMLRVDQVIDAVINLVNDSLGSVVLTRSAPPLARVLTLFHGLHHVK